MLGPLLKLITLSSFLRTTPKLFRLKRSQKDLTDISENEVNLEKERKIERDLSVNTGYDLKCNGHVNSVVGKANRMLGMLKRSFEIRDHGLWKDLYFTLVCLHLEYDVQVLNPHLQGDIHKIERVQIRATRITLGFAKLQYEEMLTRFSLTTLKDRRLRGDLIKVNKVTSSRKSINIIERLSKKIPQI